MPWAFVWLEPCTHLLDEISIWINSSKWNRWVSKSVPRYRLWYMLPRHSSERLLQVLFLSSGMRQRPLSTLAARSRVLNLGTLCLCVSKETARLWKRHLDHTGSRVKERTDAITSHPLPLSTSLDLYKCAQFLNLLKLCKNFKVIANRAIRLRSRSIYSKPFHEFFIALYKKVFLIFSTHFDFVWFFEIGSHIAQDGPKHIMSWRRTLNSTSTFWAIELPVCASSPVSVVLGSKHWLHPC